MSDHPVLDKALSPLAMTKRLVSIENWIRTLDKVLRDEKIIE